MQRRGFTIIELIIVIVVMGILLALAVVNLRGSQIAARNTQRIGDVQTIAQNLENFYTSGNNTSALYGRYPSTLLIGNETTYLPDLDTRALTAPGQTGDSLVAADCHNTTCNQTTTGVNPQPTINQYVYQPLQSDGTLCTTESQQCRKFNIFYLLETGGADGADGTVQMVTSKNQ